MAGRRWQLDRELAPIAGERLRRLWGPQAPASGVDPAPPRGAGAPRRARPESADPVLAPQRLTATDRSEALPEVGELPEGTWSFEAGSVGLPPRRFSRWHLGVVVLVVVMGLVGGGWSLLRSRPVAVAATGVQTTTTVQPSAAEPPPASGAPTPAAASPAPDVVVHVLGAVRRPGLVRLPDRARVQDAIDAAGGLTRSADPGELNLAQPLSDGQQVVIGTRGHANGQVRGAGGASSPSDPGGSTDGTSATPLDLNQATGVQLEELPGIGPVTAQKIVAWREQHGRFSRPEELQEVGGIGPKTYAQIAPHVRV